MLLQSLSFASANDLPIYNNLSRLQLEVKCCNSHLLPILLENSPNLENLILKVSLVLKIISINLLLGLAFYTLLGLFSSGGYRRTT